MVNSAKTAITGILGQFNPALASMANIGVDIAKGIKNVSGALLGMIGLGAGIAIIVAIFQKIAEKAATAEQRLYSGAVTNPKELADLQAEGGSLGRRRQDLEERLLEAMIEREEAEDAASGGRSRLQSVQGDWSSQQSELSAELNGLRADLAALAKERDDLLPAIDEDDLAAFRSLWNRKGGVAVARVESGACGGCGVAVAPSLEWQLRQGEVACCNNCERILVRL